MAFATASIYSPVNQSLNTQNKREPAHCANDNRIVIEFQFLVLKSPCPKSEECCNNRERQEYPYEDSQQGPSFSR